MWLNRFKHLRLAYLAPALLVFCQSNSQALELELLAKFNIPVYLTHAGDKRLFVVERAGLIRVYDPDRGLLKDPFLDVSADVDTSNEGSLASMAFHPEFVDNGLFYVSYTAGNPPQSVVKRFQVSTVNADVAAEDSGVDLFRFERPSTYHNGGQPQCELY